MLIIFSLSHFKANFMCTHDRDYYLTLNALLRYLVKPENKTLPISTASTTVGMSLFYLWHFTTNYMKTCTHIYILIILHFHKNLECHKLFFLKIIVRLFEKNLNKRGLDKLYLIWFNSKADLFDCMSESLLINVIIQNTR